MEFFPDFTDRESPIIKSYNNIVTNDHLLEKIFTSIYKVNQYYDEPQYWSYSGLINNKSFLHDGFQFTATSSGFSLINKEHALAKCIFEGVERLCNYIYRDNFAVCKASIKSIHRKFVNPLEMTRYSKSQLNNSHYRKFFITPESIFNWTSCHSCFDNHAYMVPCSLIYLSYKYLSKEPSIYPAISTGVAGGSTLSSAIVRGIFEVLERDAFVIHYLNKIPGRKIRLSKLANNLSFQKYIDIVKRYRLKISIVDISTDINIPIIAAIVIDSTGIGKAVSVGLKCSTNLVDAICGAIDEAFHTRGRLRGTHEMNDKIVGINELISKSNIQNRGIYWYPKKMINQVNFWINSDYISPLEDRITHGNYRPIPLKDVLNQLREKKYSIYYKEITLPELRQLNYHIVKVIMPDFQPLYLDENYRILGGYRLSTIPTLYGCTTKNIEELNNTPHPFL